MLPLIPFVLSLAPQVAKWIFGDKGAEVTRDVATAIRTVTGQDATTTEGLAAAQAALSGKPELAIQLQQRLAEIAAAREAEANREADAKRQSELDDLKQRLTDVASARSQTATLVTSHSPLAYGSAVLSGIILLSFAVMVWYVLQVRQLESSIAPLANVLLGTLAAMATQVANYWLGSSSGSAAKNSLIASAQVALANSTPGGAVSSVNLGPSVQVAGNQSSPAAAANAAAAAAPIMDAMNTDDLNARSLAAARSNR